MDTRSEIGGIKKIRPKSGGIDFLHFIAFLLTIFFGFLIFFKFITCVTYITANIFPTCHLIVAISMFYTCSMSNKVIFIIYILYFPDTDTV